MEPTDADPTGAEPNRVEPNRADPTGVEPGSVPLAVAPGSGIPTHRPAARVLCLDAAHRLLLLRWRDPHDGTFLWEPPGGGVEPGETPLDAARRELAEETGLDPSAVLDHSVPVPRDVHWKGQRYLGSEDFFLARFTGERPPLAREGLLPDERATLQGHAWVPWRDLGSLPDPVEPPGLADVLRALDPHGPWSGARG